MLLFFINTKKRLEKSSKKEKIFNFQTMLNVCEAQPDLNGAHFLRREMWWEK